MTEFQWLRKMKRTTSLLITFQAIQKIPSRSQLERKCLRRHVVSHKLVMNMPAKCCSALRFIASISKIRPRSCRGTVCGNVEYSPSRLNNSTASLCSALSLFHFASIDGSVSIILSHSRTDTQILRKSSALSGFFYIVLNTQHNQRWANEKQDNGNPTRCRRTSRRKSSRKKNHRKHLSRHLGKNLRNQPETRIHQKVMSRPARITPRRTPAVSASCHAGVQMKMRLRSKLHLERRKMVKVPFEL